MGSDSTLTPDEPIIFADEDLPPGGGGDPGSGGPGSNGPGSGGQPDPWIVLVVDDEEDVHDITRITLKGYTFEGRPVSLLSAYSAREVRQIMARENDIALVLLDVVMEEEDTGLKLVAYIRAARAALPLPARPTR